MAEGMLDLINPVDQSKGGLHVAGQVLARHQINFFLIFQFSENVLEFFSSFFPISKP